MIPDTTPPFPADNHPRPSTDPPRAIPVRLTELPPPEDWLPPMPPQQEQRREGPSEPRSENPAAPHREHQPGTDDHPRRDLRHRRRKRKFPNRGRPEVLDEIKRREIVALLSVGCTRDRAARHVGCALRTLHNLIARDEAFAEQVRRAETACEAEHLRNIQHAGRRWWRAAAWALERMDPNQYARRSAESMQPKELERVLETFAEAIFEEIHDDDTRDRIVARLQKLFDAVDAQCADPNPRDKPFSQ